MGQQRETDLEEERLKKAPKSISVSIQKISGAFSMDRLDGFVLVLEGSQGRYQSTPILTDGNRGQLQVYAAGSPGRIQAGHEHLQNGHDCDGAGPFEEFPGDGYARLFGRHFHYAQVSELKRSDRSTEEIKTWQSKHPVRLLIIAVLLSSSATIIALRWDLIPGFSRKEVPVPAFASAPAGQPALSSDEEINVRVYKTVSPGVVNITSTVVEYDWFFAPYAPEGSTGSGCILDTDGNILTNYHVIQSADSLEVTLPDETKYHAKVVGIRQAKRSRGDPHHRRPKERLHPITLGDSNALSVGQKVLAIGNPLGLQNTLTIGIVSSLGRRIQD